MYASSGIGRPQNEPKLADVSTVPLGLDPSLYPWVPSERRGQDRPNVTLIGSMSWMPGVSAARRLLTRLWPEILRRVPGARLNIVGWAARGALREFLDAPGVTIVENVPEARSYFEAAGVLVYAPERGSGMKIKVLEAMAFGVPVVTTTEGVEGLPALDGVQAGVCDDDAGLIERTVALSDRTHESQDRLRTAARELARGVVRSGPQRRGDRSDLCADAGNRRLTRSVAARPMAGAIMAGQTTLDRRRTTC